MAIPQNKKELLLEIETTYAKLREDLLSVPQTISGKLSLEGHAKGTRMSVNNLVSYLIGWGELVLKWHRIKNQGKPVDLPETGYKWNELGLLAQKFYKDYESLEYLYLLKKLNTTVEQIQNLVKVYSNEELYVTAWYEQWTRGRLIQLNTSSPYKNARIPEKMEEGK